MSLAFAIGLAIGSALVVFGRHTPPVERVIACMHLQAARLRRWLSGGG